MLARRSCRVRPSAVRCGVGAAWEIWLAGEGWADGVGEVAARRRGRRVFRMRGRWVMIAFSTRRCRSELCVFAVLGVVGCALFTCVSKDWVGHGLAAARGESSRVGVAGHGVLELGVVVVPLSVGDVCRSSKNGERRTRLGGGEDGVGLLETADDE